MALYLSFAMRSAIYSKRDTIYQVHGRASSIFSANHKAASTVSTSYSKNHLGHFSVWTELRRGSAHCDCKQNSDFVPQFLLSTVTKVEKSRHGEPQHHTSDIHRNQTAAYPQSCTPHTYQTGSHGLVEVSHHLPPTAFGSG